MRTVARLAAVLLLGALAWPEIPRYEAERRVGFATSAFRDLLDRIGEPGATPEILEVGSLALGTAARLPGDPRPLILAASSFLVTSQPERALELYRDALGTGERAEIDLNLGRSYALLRNKENADAAFLRAGWVSPEILASLPASIKDPFLFEVNRLAEELRAGRLAAPPPLPSGGR